MSIIGGILAGGRGRRMEGIDKPFALLAGKPLVAHVIDRLAPQVDRLVINANAPPDRFADFGLDVIADKIVGYRGPLAGIHALMQHAHALGASHLLAAAADTPFLPRDLTERLWRAGQDPEVVRIARSNGRRHPVIALWPVALAGRLGAHLADTDDLSMAAFVKQVSVTGVDFPDNAGLDPFFNINSPTDLARAEQQLAGFERSPE